MELGQVFFYVDGIPTKGAWVDMESISDWDEVEEALKAEGFEAEGGDILVTTSWRSNALSYWGVITSLAFMVYLLVKTVLISQ